MKLNTNRLLQQLINDTSHQLQYAEQLRLESHALLNKKRDETAWSISQVLQHVNTYSAYYLPLIAEALSAAPTAPTSEYKAGWLGNYFVGMMEPDNGTIKKKYKAHPKHLPAANLNGAEILFTYINHQKHLLKLLEQTAAVDINHIRIPISIAPFIKLKLGDVLRFVVAHQQRHTLQMQKISDLNTSSEPA